MKKWAWICGATFVFFAGVAMTSGSRADLPPNWKPVELPGLSQAWENSRDPRQTLTIVETHTEDKMSFRGEARESIASGLIAFRQATLKEFNITDFTVRDFNYEARETCERVTFTGSYIRPEGVKVQFVEHDVFRDHQMIQSSVLMDQDTIPTDERELDQLLTTVDTCE